MNQSLATVVIPFARKLSKGVNDALDRLGSMEDKPYKDMSMELEKDPFVHFMSMIVVPAHDREMHAHLVMEVSADADPPVALQRLAIAIPGTLGAILEEAGHGSVSAEQLADFLVEREQDAGAALIHTVAGLKFMGTPDMSVRRIKHEAKLSCRIRDLLESLPPNSALSKLRAVRRILFGEVEYKWAFVSEPVARVLGDAKPVSKLSLARAAFRDFLWPLALPPVLAFIISRATGSGLFDALWHSLATLLIELVIAAAIALGGYLLLRREEKDDVPIDVEPMVKDMTEILEREDRPGYVQNHLAGVSVMKPGWVRWVTLRLALWLIGESGAKRSRPGFIDEIGSIHFARWLRLPGTDRLVFLSNYDGSWQSYLEDFIARLQQGLSSVWSNTRDFPKTTKLRFEGAADGARFKRWARRQQVPTRFWYSAYPQLTTQRIRTNAAIRHGFASASTEDEAAEWLSHFGYAGRESLAIREIPILAFGGLRTMPFAHCLIVRLPSAQGARRWLKSIESDISYGDRAAKTSALVVAFTSDGLRRLGLDELSLATFPIAFQQGMSDPRRARSLGDDPGTWDWGRDGTDALLMLYNVSSQELQEQVEGRRTEIEEFGGSITRDVPIVELKEDVREAFGFRDGISQPVMRGTIKASREAEGMNTVQPGELVLGYRDNLGIVAPGPMAQGQDIGRNGSFLVVRQIEQDPPAFSKHVAEVAAELIKANDPRAPSHDQAELEDWIAAKMMGRWKDGTSLVRHPREPGSKGRHHATPDNAFLFGSEDPDGLRCPFGAHVRRANPRDSFDPGSQKQIDISNRHRILRVGRLYDPTSSNSGKPGLLFMCVNADIERQFEFLQQSWILGPSFHGLEDEVDPIVGCTDKGMTVPTPNGPLRVPTLAAFVKVLGGGYFFMPGKAAVQELAQ